MALAGYWHSCGRVLASAQEVNAAAFPKQNRLIGASGAPVVMCDGSVRLLSEDKSLEVVVAMLSRDGGETDLD